MAMRILLALIAGLLIGAAAFHAYYLRLAPPGRCIWDHPFSAGAREACRQRRAAGGYDAAARRALDDLIGDVAK